jgi:hypothetical protein
MSMEAIRAGLSRAVAVYPPERVGSADFEMFSRDIEGATLPYRNHAKIAARCWLNPTEPGHVISRSDTRIGSSGHCGV